MYIWNPGLYIRRGCKAFEVKYSRQFEGGATTEGMMEVNGRSEKHVREMLAKYSYVVLSIRCVETFKD